MNHFYDDAVAVISFANDDIPSKRRPPMSSGHAFSLFSSLSSSSVPAVFPWMGGGSGLQDSGVGSPSL